jgi:GNAT superfamily N-acetyltransferase/predicted nucleic acid-binding protein
MVNMGGITVLSIDQRSPHLTAVSQLWHKNKVTLGFFPEGAFVDHAARRQIIVALNHNDECIGYLLYRPSGMKIVIVHLCVRDDNRRQGVAKQLLDHLKSLTRAYLGIGLNCRRDFPANKIWPQLNFYPVDEKHGRGKEKHLLSTWWFDYGKPTLFTALSRAKSRAVLDANVLFDLQDPLSKKTEQSKALESPWLREVMFFCLTDETYHEINRNADEIERKRRRSFARTFPTLHYDHNLLDEVFSQLRVPFSGKSSLSRGSDLNQLAKAIAANAHFFVTRDKKILNRADEIYSRWGIKVVGPCELITLTDEVIHGIQYQPLRLAGSLIRSQRNDPGASAFKHHKLRELLLCFRISIGVSQRENSCILCRVALLSRLHTSVAW